MPQLKRDCIKYIRDRAKSRYEKGSECEICGEAEDLDFHHFYSMTPLLDKWLRKSKEQKEYVMAWRDDFIAEHETEIFDETVTLCHTHHLQLHSVYGKNPALGTAKKQKRWVTIQREKLNGVV